MVKGGRQTLAENSNTPELRYSCVSMTLIFRCGSLLSLWVFFLGCGGTVAKSDAGLVPVGGDSGTGDVALGTSPPDGKAIPATDAPMVDARDTRMTSADTSTTSVDVRGADSARAETVRDLGPPLGTVYVSPTGSDTQLGTRAAPFQTLKKVFSLAQPGDVVVLLDGTFDVTTQPELGITANGACDGSVGIFVPAGITLAADNPGAAKVVVSGSHGLCLLGASVRGVAFAREGQGGHMLEVLAGDNRVERSSFSSGSCYDAGGSAIEVSGSATLVLDGSGVPSLYEVDTCGFLITYDTADVRVVGGTINSRSSFRPVPVMYATLASKLTLEGVILEGDSADQGILLSGTSELQLLKGTVLKGFTKFCVEVDNKGGKLAATDTTFSNCAGSAVLLSGLSPTKVDLTFLRTQFLKGGTALSAFLTSPLNLSMTDSTVSDFLDGLKLEGQLGVIAITDSTFSNISGMGINIRGNPCPNLRLRGNHFTGRALAGMNLECTPTGSHADLGTLADPGLNVFQNSIPASLRLNMPTVTIPAVGNIWNPGVQGADADGRYTVQGAGANLTVSSSSNDSNYVIGAGSLLLAENAP